MGWNECAGGFVGRSFGRVRVDGVRYDRGYRTKEDVNQITGEFR